MKKLLIILGITVQTVWAQDITGTWSGELSVQGMKLPLVFHITKNGDSYKTTMNSPRQGTGDMPVQETLWQNGELVLRVPALNMTYTAKFINDTLEGTFSQRGLNVPLVLQRGIRESQIRNRPQTPQPPYPFYTEEVEFVNEKEGNRLAGTLFTPDSAKDFPVLVLITGSGAQNRDSEIMEHKPFLVLADYLARRGIGTLRLDDRGIGGSEAGKPEPVSADFAGDIESAVNFLAGKGYHNIGLAGHSEGGAIAPMVAVNNDKVRFMVLLAAPGIRGSKLMEIQMYGLHKVQGMPEALSANIRAGYAHFFKRITKTEGVLSKAEVEEELNRVYTDMVESQRAGMVNGFLSMMSSRWFHYFIRYDPDVYLSRVQIPVLAINGGKDLNVTAKENLAGIRASLTKAGNRNFEIFEPAGLNHLFQTTQTGDPREYAILEETLSPVVLEKVAAWVSALK